jgi:lipopolysaccharide/colanic/teichoic acid biosynthesis glycosyltransferase
VAFEISSSEAHVAGAPLPEGGPRDAQALDEHNVIILPEVASAPLGAVTSVEGDVKVVWTPQPLTDADVLPLLPRRARPPWIRPDVLVLGEELPSFLRAEKGFHVLTAHGVRDLLAAPRRSPHGFWRARHPEAFAPIVAVPDAFECDPALLADLRRLEEAGLRVLPLSAIVRRRCRLELLDREPAETRPKRAREVLHRAVDVAVALVGVAATAVLLPFVAAALWIEDRGPVFYAQERVGRGGRTFRLLKFRSMRPDAESHGPAWATADDDRTTRVGGFLRRFKLDELPQFLNVLLGHMSLVGPRPERPFFVDILKTHVPHYELRHRVRPGLTGWGTVKVGYGNSIEAKYLQHQFDLYHLAHRSLRFDIEIMARSARFLVLPPEIADRYML